MSNRIQRVTNGEKEIPNKTQGEFIHMKTTFKKATKVALATALLTGAFATTTAANGLKFSDVPETNVHYDNIYNLAHRQVVEGYPDGTYQPARHLTRAEAAVILANALDLDTSDVVDPGFTDLKKGAWYYDEIAILAENNILKGYGNGKFGPHDKLTREQMAVVLSYAYDLFSNYDDDLPFTDVKPGNFYEGYIQNLYAFDVTNGISATKYGPKELVRRDAMASFVVRAEEVTSEQRYEEMIPLFIGAFNNNPGKVMQAGWDKDTNTIMIGIAPTNLTADYINESVTFFGLLDFYSNYAAYVKGSDFDLTMVDRDEAEQEIFKALGVDKDADLNEVEGKQVTFVLEGMYGDTFEYTVTFSAQAPN